MLSSLFFYFSNDIIKKMKMKIIRKISGLFLAFMLLFAVLFVIAPQEEVKADAVANNITSIDDLKGTVWELKNGFEDINTYYFIGAIGYDSLSSTSKPDEPIIYYYYENERIEDYSLSIYCGNDDNQISSIYLANRNNTTNQVKQQIFQNGVFLNNYGNKPRQIAFGNWENGQVVTYVATFEDWLTALNTFFNRVSFNDLKEQSFILNETLNKNSLSYSLDTTLMISEGELDVNNENILEEYEKIVYNDYIYNEDANQTFQYITITQYELTIGNFPYLVNGEPVFEIYLLYDWSVEAYVNDYGLSPRQLNFGNWENGVLYFADDLTLNADYLLFDFLNLNTTKVVKNYITIIDNVNNTSYEIEYQEGYTLEANNIYLNALEYQEVEANSPFNNFVNVYKKFTGWSIISLSGFPRSYDITLPFTFTSQYSGEDWLLLPRYEDIDYIPFNLIVNNVREGVDNEEVIIWGAIPVINNEVVINNNMLAYLNYSLIIGAEVTDSAAPPTINYRANVLFNNLELNNNQIILSSDVNSSNIIAVELTYLSNAIISANGSITGENVVSYYKNYNVSGNYADTINIVDRTTNAYIQIRIAVRNNTPVDTGDINIKSAFTTFFSLVGGFLSMKLGFITLGEIIGLVLAIALLGFIFKVWNGGNNG